MGNLLGLDYSAIKSVMDIYSVPNELRPEIFNKVLQCFQWSIEVSKEMESK
jgi:hypothetical protein